MTEHPPWEPITPGSILNLLSGPELHAYLEEQLRTLDAKPPAGRERVGGEGTPERE